MQPAIELKRKLAGPGPTVGVMISNHLWLEVIEIAVEAGLDYVIIDAEHMAHCPERIADACRLGRMTNFPVLLRPARTDTESIRMAMDLGPCGMLLPMIESTLQLEQVKNGIYMPPRGQRRPGGPGNGWVKRYTYDTFKANVEDHVIVIPQVESPLGLQNAGEIAAHPIVTALGVGPFDLSASLGLCWKPEHPTFKGALAHIRDAARAAAKPVWMIGDAKFLLEEGYRFLCMGEPTAMLQRMLTDLVRQLRAIGRPISAEDLSNDAGKPLHATRNPQQAAHAQGKSGDGAR